MQQQCQLVLRTSLWNRPSVLRHPRVSAAPFALALQEEHAEGSSAPHPSGRSRSTGRHCSYRQIRQAGYPGPLHQFQNHQSSSLSSSSDDEEEKEDLDLEIGCQLYRTDFEC